MPRENLTPEIDLTERPTSHDLRLGYTRVPTGKKMACSGSTGLLEGVANQPRNSSLFQELGTAARRLMRVRVLVCKVLRPGEFFNALIRSQGV